MELADKPQDAVGGATGLDENESRRLLRIVSHARTVKRHVELFQMMQGEIQFFLPHQILISAWGDLRGGHLKFDVTSALPGMRTAQLNDSDVGSLLRNIYSRWVDHDRQPLLLETAEIKRLMKQDCSCALHKVLRGMRAMLVHGMHSARDGSDTLYLAASAGPIARLGGLERFHRVVDLVIAQIDVAYRRVTGLQVPTTGVRRQGFPGSTDALTRREEEILSWVAHGRTNMEVSQILAISAFTVKNHVQRIIKKLGAANRTEAAAAYRLGNRQAPGAGTRRRVFPVLEAPDTAQEPHLRP